MKYVFDNGLTLIYEKRQSKITSVSIALEAGACAEKNMFGVAHATEHMVYKGTFKLTENQINKQLSEIFAFQNAMTNYPYVIYYGSLLEEDFNKSMELFSDILINPAFTEVGFNEEIEVIKQELSEWNSDLEQYTEDKLFFNAFKGRLKNPIIGTKESLDNMTVEDVKEFYSKYYCPNNTTIAVVSSIEFDKVVKIINDCFSKWKVNKLITINECVEKLSEKIYTNYKYGISVSRAEIIFSLTDFSERELKNIIIFDELFGKGVNSILFDCLRTKNSLVYDVITNVSYEKNIKLYKITFNTSNKNIDRAIKYVQEIIKNIDTYIEKIDNNFISKVIKKINLKRMFMEEKSINLAKSLSTNNVMFKNEYMCSFTNDDNEVFSIEEIKNTIKLLVGKYEIQKIICK
ncbi:M16 family metallopeptidase [Clostridium sp. HCP1S3_A12]|nr:pitrilysin family protein [Clostridiales bacterium]MDY2729677.1 pitrilysin family protein [Clostridium sp.]